jgi:hypothetical protein
MEINLLPPESVVQRYSVALSAIGISTFSVLSVVFGLLGYLSHQDIDAKESLVQSLSQRLSQNQQAISEMQSQISGTANAQDSSAVQTAVDVISTVHAIQTVSHGYVDIHSISMNGAETFTINGHAKSLTSIAEFSRKIEELPQNMQVWLNNTQSDTSGVNFSISVTINEGNSHS